MAGEMHDERRVVRRRRGLDASRGPFVRVRVPRDRWTMGRFLRESEECGKRRIGDFGEVGDFVDFPEEKFGGRGRKMGRERTTSNAQHRISNVQWRKRGSGSQWQIANGRSQMADRKWQIANGRSQKLAEEAVSEGRRWRNRGAFMGQDRQGICAARGKGPRMTRMNADSARTERTAREGRRETQWQASGNATGEKFRFRGTQLSCWAGRIEKCRLQETRDARWADGADQADAADFRRGEGALPERTPKTQKDTEWDVHEKTSISTRKEGAKDP
jgi:hypothetical protein